MIYKSPVPFGSNNCQGERSFQNGVVEMTFHSGSNSCDKKKKSFSKSRSIRVCWNSWAVPRESAYRAMTDKKQGSEARTFLPHIPRRLIHELLLILAESRQHRALALQKRITPHMVVMEIPEQDIRAPMHGPDVVRV